VAREEPDTRSTLEDRGIIYLFGAIDESKVETVSQRIIELNLMPGIDCIQLLVSSGGGEVAAGFALLDIMEWSRVPVFTTGLGMLGSMGLLVFMAGERGHRVEVGP
jgi:ATP-dependent Clp protease protease subunit